jgi:hypothetical protein
MGTFKDRLALGLTLTGATTQEVDGSEIKRIDLHLTNAGWSGTIEFDIYDDAKGGGDNSDTFKPSYLQSTLIQVTLRIAEHQSDKKDLPAPPLALKGLVTKRALREFPVRARPLESQIMTRRYRIEVADAAQVLWRQHHPCRLYADKTMKYILNEQKSDLIQFNCSWSWVDRAPYKTPMVFFALDPSIGPASFYDWVMWYVDRHRLIWTYNCRTNEYSIEETKTATGTAIGVDWRNFLPDRSDPSPSKTILALDLAVRPDQLPTGKKAELRPRDDDYEMYERGYTIDVPEVPRYSGAVLDSCRDPVYKPELIENPKIADPMIKRHTLLRTPLSADITQRVALERARMVPNPEPELSLCFNRVPIKPLFPGDLAEFTSPEWNADAWPVEQQLFRVYDVVLRAHAADIAELAGYRQVHARYKVDYIARLEVARDLTTPRLPAFVEPTYPVYVEGRILSTINAAGAKPGAAGAKPDAAGGAPPPPEDPASDPSLTYEYETPYGPFVYRVQVPLWADSAPEITAPYEPGRMPGQLFFPAYKDERVVLAMTWRKAWIDSFVNWRQGVTMPSDMQGNQMLLGKTEAIGNKDKFSRTLVRNYYENRGSLLPIFEIERKHAVDYQKVRISEGNLLIEVNEE